MRTTTATLATLLTLTACDDVEVGFTSTSGEDGADDGAEPDEYDLCDALLDDWLLNHPDAVPGTTATPIPDTYAPPDKFPAVHSTSPEMRFSPGPGGAYGSWQYQAGGLIGQAARARLWRFWDPQAPTDGLVEHAPALAPGDSAEYLAYAIALEDTSEPTAQIVHGGNRAIASAFEYEPGKWMMHAYLPATETNPLTSDDPQWRVWGTMQLALLGHVFSIGLGAWAAPYEDGTYWSEMVHGSISFRPATVTCAFDIPEGGGLDTGGGGA